MQLLRYNFYSQFSEQNSVVILFLSFKGLLVILFYVY